MLCFIGCGRCSLHQGKAPGFAPSPALPAPPTFNDFELFPGKPGTLLNPAMLLRIHPAEASPLEDPTLIVGPSKILLLIQGELLARPIMLTIDKRLSHFAGDRFIA
jgi:hypothetical protein